MHIQKYFRFIACWIFAAFVYQGIGQATFEGEVFQVEGRSFTSGAPMGCADVNGDGLDDLVILDDAHDLFVIYRTNGFGEYAMQHLGRVSNDINWAIQVADIDQDGFRDIFVANSMNMIVYEGSGIQPEFTKRRITAPSFLPQASNFVDMDGDNDLDLFVCNDIGINFVALNDGLGNFTPVDTLMDFSTDPSSDGSGNYGSHWCDYDRDGDQDLYIAKCRGAAPAGDPRRTNQFFRNTGNGFERITEYPELLSNDQSWVAEFLDVDNDGDWDILLANHDAPMNLFIQDDNGDFVDEAAERGIDFSAGVIQLVSADYDNDGDIDVFVAGNDHILFLNDGAGNFYDGGFTEDLDKQIESATCGDFNSDGRIDLYTGFADLYNTPTNVPDRLFTNTSLNKNYLTLTLRGEKPNTLAIGATVEIYHGDRFQMREIRSGESYGINKSSNIHFGLDTFSRIDSCIIYWPSGLVERRYERLEANRGYHLTENVGFSSNSQFHIAPGKPGFCEGDTLVLNAPGGEAFLWSTGDTTETILVDTPGLYNVQVRRQGIWRLPAVFNVKTESTERPVISYSDELIKCPGDTIELFVGQDHGVVAWNSGSVGGVELAIDTGAYYFSDKRVCGLYYSDTVHVRDYDVPIPTFESDTVEQGMPALLISTSDQTTWASDMYGQDILFRGDTFFIDALHQDSVVYAAGYAAHSFDAESVGLTAPNIAVDGYHHESLNFGVYFNVREDGLLESVRVFADTQGRRDIVIRDAWTWEEYGRVHVDIPAGWNEIDLDMAIEAGGEYELLTDPDTNLLYLGHESPGFIRSAGAVTYPFTSSVLDITGNSFGVDQYYYFYDWQVRRDDGECSGAFSPVHAVVDSVVAVYHSEVLNTTRVYPNPSSGYVIVDSGDSEGLQRIEIWSGDGLLIKRIENIDRRQLTIHLHVPGFYMLNLVDKMGARRTEKLLILPN